MTASVCYVVNIGYKLKNVVNGYNCVNIHAVSVNKNDVKNSFIGDLAALEQHTAERAGGKQTGIKG